MLTQILSFLISVIFGALIGAALLRCYFNFVAIPMGNPLGQFLIALTDWIVRPLRRVFKPTGRFDWASFIAASLLALAQTLLIVALLGITSMPIEMILWRALAELIRIALQTLIVFLLIYAVLSWVNPHAPLFMLLDRMFAPLLKPLRRIIPPIGGVDISSLVLIIILQIGLMVLARLV